MGPSFVTILFIVLFISLFAVLMLRYQRVKSDLDLQTVRVFQFNGEFSNKDKSDIPSSPFSELIELNKYEMGKEFKMANLILFTDYSLIDQNLGRIPFNHSKMYYIYGMNGSDEMANKANLAIYLRSNGYDKYIPRSFVLDNPEDIRILKSQHTDDSLYMIKKNIQRQEGNTITKDIDFITTEAGEQDYVVCQELLQNPFLVNGRKINMRVYLLVVIHEKKARFYIYNNGFMYYTPQHFKKGSTDRDVNITTGYIDRQVYVENPLTHKDFYQYLGENKATLLQNNIVTTFQTIKETYLKILINKNKNIPGIKFNIFGVDIAPDENLNTTIIEINKGPDLSYKDDRDKAVKLNMTIDCFTLLGLSKQGHPENFIML